MNPTANKSDFEDLTTHLRDLAYSYLEKYNPSKQQLKVYLLKKYLTIADRRGWYLLIHIPLLKPHIRWYT